MTKRVFAAALCALMLCAAFAGIAPAASADAAPTGEYINVYNWGMYISDGSDGCIDVNAEFEKATGIKVNYSTYDSNEALYAKLKTGGASYDVIIPSDYMAAKLIEEGMVQKLDYSNIPNYAGIDEQFKNRSYDPKNEYTVPYTWGTVGIIYNTKYVSGTPDSWDLLWNEDYKGKILMFDNSRDAFAAAELLLGIDVNTTDTAELDKASAKLAEQMPLVQANVMDQVYSAMQTEEAWIAPYYGGDYLLMAQENENLAFYFPKEGYNLFIDAMCIPTSAQNKTAAEKYINFLCEAQISGENLDYLGYSTPITAAKEFMDEDTVASPIAYPDEQTLARGVTFENVPTDTMQYMNDKFNSVKATDSGWSIWIIVAIIVILIAAAVLLYLRKKKRSNY